MQRRIFFKVTFVDKDRQDILLGLFGLLLLFKMNKFAVRILKALIVLIGLAILIIYLVSFFDPWYHYGNITESFRGYTSNGQLKQWGDTPYNHLQNLYLVTELMAIATFIVDFIFLLVMFLMLLGRFCSLKWKLGLKFMKAKAKRISVITALIVVVLSAFTCFFYMIEHPTAVEDDKFVSCGDSSPCQKFSGDQFGPDVGWNCALACFILALVQLLLVLIYAGVVKTSGYQSIR